MSLKPDIRVMKRTGPMCLRAVLALVLLFPTVMGCLSDAGPAPRDSASPTPPPSAAHTNTPEAVASPEPTPRWTPIPTPPPLTSSCTQADVLGDPTPAYGGPQPIPHSDNLVGTVIFDCGDTPKASTGILGLMETSTEEEDEYGLALSLRYSPNHFIEWTPDGNQLMLNDPDESEAVGSGIYIVNSDESSFRLLVDANPGYYLLARFYADLSPDGSTLVYSTCEFEDSWKEYVIATLSVESGTSQQLTERGGIHSNSVWSPDGKQVAFVISSSPYQSWSSPITTPFTIASGGNDLHALTPYFDPGYLVGFEPPSWSPDGKRLAYVQYGGDYHRLYTVGADGLGLHGVTAVTTGATWAPEGRLIAFGKLLPRNARDDPYSTLCMAEVDDLGRLRLKQIVPRDARRPS